MRPRHRPSYTNVAATLAICLALASPAWAEPVAHTAASLGKNVKQALKLGRTADKRSKKALKTARQALAAGEAAGSPGPQGSAGPRGETGATGAPGRSALSSLQSGETLRGVYATQGGGGSIIEGITLPVPAPAAIDSRHVVVAGNDIVAGHGCAGTAANPVSAPGFACVYLVNAVGTSAAYGLGTPYGNGGPTVGGDGSRFGFQVQIIGPGAMRADGVWVYTAP